MNEGKIRFRDRARQLLLFEGCTMHLPTSVISPTDVDGIINISQKMWAVIESKRRGAPLPTGQRIMIEELLTDWHKAGKPAIVIIVEHDVDVDTDISLRKDCTIREIYHFDNTTGKVESYKTTYTDAWEYIEQFRRAVGKGEISA